MEFHDLDVFLAVVKEKSFSRAAQRVFRTQPAVSLSIRRLEEELNGELFDRSSKEPILTDLGRIILDYAEQILNIRNQIEPAVHELKNLQRGRIRIGANESGVMFVLPYIAAFRQKFPEIHIDVVRAQAKDIPQELHKRFIDLGVLTYDPKDPNILTTAVYEDQSAFVVHPIHPLAKKRVATLEQLGKESFAAHNVESPFRKRIIKTFEDAKIPLKIVVELPTLDAIKKFVLMGQAVAVLPKMCVQSELDRGELVEVKVLEIRSLKRKLRLAQLKTQSKSVAAQKFMEEATRLSNR